MGFVRESSLRRGNCFSFVEEGTVLVVRHGLEQLKRLKNQAERAIAQTKDEHFSATLDANANSIAVIMGHLVGNMHSRVSMWRPGSAAGVAQLKLCRC